MPTVCEQNGQYQPTQSIKSYTEFSCPTWGQPTCRIDAANLECFPLLYYDRQTICIVTNC